MTKKSLAETIKETEDCFPTIFTREDVLLILNNIEENSLNEQEQISILKDNISSALRKMDGDNVVDFDSADFDICDGNKIEIINIDVNSYNIDDVINEVIDNHFNDGN